MNEDKPEIKPEFNNPEIKPKTKPAIKTGFKKERQPVKLRFRFKFFFIIFILAVGIYLGTGPVVESAAKFIIRKIFVDSTVSIASLSIKPTHQISFRDIKISKGKIYDIVIKEASLNFTIPSLFKKIMPELVLKNIKFTANSSQTRLKDLIQSIKISTNKKAPSKATPSQAKAKTQDQTKAQKPTSIISKLDIPDLFIDLNIKDAKVNALASLSLNLQDKQLSFLNVNAKKMFFGKVALWVLDLHVAQAERKGILNIKQANFGRLKIKDIKSRAVLEGLILSLDDLSGQFLSKKVTSEITLNLWPVLECTSNIKFAGISCAALSKELGWENKINVSGLLYGKATFRAESNQLAMLNVNFIAPAPGATLTISDPGILQKISRQTRQPLGNISESFRDYHYEKGQLIVSLLQKALDLEIILDGQQGRRNLKFNLIDANAN
jgi:hypothetical protein